MNLREWQCAQLPVLRKQRFAISRHVKDVTVVAYAFPKEAESEAFDYLECAILQTWAVIGLLKTVVVAHRHFAKLDVFAAKYSHVDVQIEPTLEPGKIESMSADCCSRLHARFETPYCLVIQDDGFPLRDRLDDFLNKYDYVGAPYVRIAWWRNVICRVLGCWVSNGGFSLRSRAICQAAAEHWSRKYGTRHPSRQTVDDLFYTQTLPLHHLAYRLKYKIAPNTVAIRFSYDAIVKQPVKTCPMGFHRTATFEELSEAYSIERSPLDVNEVPIFVSSCDSYSDIWPAFFALLKREWPEYRGTIYLNTETLDYVHEGLNIVCTKLGKQRKFGESFLKGISCVEGDAFLLLMIDYFIEAKVDVAKLQEVYDIFIHEGVDTFTLTTQPYGFKPLQSISSYSRLDPREAWRIMFSFQAAFWEKVSLQRIIYCHEDPWRAEYFGSRRASLEGMDFLVLACREDKPIKYDESGVLHGGGKWLMSALTRINFDSIPLNLERSPRLVYKESSISARDFIRGEIHVTPMKICSWVMMMAKHPKAVFMLVADLRRRCSQMLKAFSKY